MPDRPIWGRAVIIALLAHAALVAVLVWRGLPSTFPADAALTRPMIEGALVPRGASDAGAGGQPAKSAMDAQSTPVHYPFRASSTEPGAEAVRRAAQILLHPAAQTPESQPRAMDTLLAKAESLEQISNPHEVSRMATAIREAMGLSAPSAGESRWARLADFDFDKCQLSDIDREEVGPRTVLRETFSQPDGGFIQIEYEKDVSEKGAAGEGTGPSYRSRSVDADGPHDWSISMEEDFNEVLARHRPFAVMQRFPLMEQLHREAIIPLLDKLAAEDAETQPATPAGL